MVEYRRTVDIRVTVHHAERSFTAVEEWYLYSHTQEWCRVHHR